MKQDDLLSHQYDPGKNISFGVYSVKYGGTKSRFTFPSDIRPKETNAPIGLFYDISRRRALVILNQDVFRKEFPDIILTQVNFNEQGKITLPEEFLTRHRITLVEGQNIYFLSSPGRDGNGIIEIYFSDKDFQSVVQCQDALAEKIANILTTPDLSGCVMVPRVYTPLQLVSPGNTIPFGLSGTATFTT